MYNHSNFQPFQISSITSNRKLINVSGWNEYSPNLNTYSVITGKNGCGKSRLLAKAVNAFLYDKSRGDIELSPSSIRSPERIVAVSNAKYDRFPQKSIALKHNPENINKYFYMGGKSDSRGVYGVLLDCFTELLSQYLKGDAGYNSNIVEVLEVLGFEPVIQFQFGFVTTNKTSDSLSDAYHSLRPSFESFSYHDEAFINERNMRLINNWHVLTYGLNPPLGNDSKTQDEIIFHTKKHRNIFIDLRYPFNGIPDYNWAVHILWGILSGIVKLKNCLVRIRTHSKYLGVLNLSSGEQSMLTMVLVCGFFIRNNSLVCVDEPENSLHPEWQMDFIKVLSKICDHVRGCHVFIATHSPQIVSGMNGREGFIIDLASESMVDATHYYKQSADYQLTQVFRTPGYRNEYLIRVLLVMLSKITSHEALSSGDYQNLELLRSLDSNDQFEMNDPVQHLYHQVRTLIHAG